MKKVDLSENDAFQPQTNGEILDELLTRWEEMGYRFGSLEEFE